MSTMQSIKTQARRSGAMPLFKGLVIVLCVAAGTALESPLNVASAHEPIRPGRPALPSIPRRPPPTLPARPPTLERLTQGDIPPGLIGPELSLPAELRLDAEGEYDPLGFGDFLSEDAVRRFFGGKIPDAVIAEARQDPELYRALKEKAAERAIDDLIYRTEKYWDAKRKQAEQEAFDALMKEIASDAGDQQTTARSAAETKDLVQKVQTPEVSGAAPSRRVVELDTDSGTVYLDILPVTEHRREIRVFDEDGFRLDRDRDAVKELMNRVTMNEGRPLTDDELLEHEAKTAVTEAWREQEEYKVRQPQEDYDYARKVLIVLSQMDQQMIQEEKQRAAADAAWAKKFFEDAIQDERSRMEDLKVMAILFDPSHSILWSQLREEDAKKEMKARQAAPSTPARQPPPPPAPQTGEIPPKPPGRVAMTEAAQQEAARQYYTGERTPLRQAIDKRMVDQFRDFSDQGILTDAEPHISFVEAILQTMVTGRNP